MAEILFKTHDLSFKNMITYQNFEIFKGEVTFIIGESGSGKSTLLRLFNQTLSASSGEIFFLGKNTRQIDTIKLRKDVSLLSQDVFLYDDTIKNNFKKFYNFRCQKMIEDDEIKYFLDICCIDFDLDEKCTTMSGGEKQRIYMAIFLSFCPPVIMLDEPTSALDNKNSTQVIGNIIDYCKKKGLSVIIVSHDNALMENFSENIIEIEKKVI